MKKNLRNFLVVAGIGILSAASLQSKAQTCEWRLVNPTYNSTDPDGAGPATGSVSFTLQIHTISGQINNVNTITVGWSYQSSNTMIPTTPACAIVSKPGNVTISAPFQPSNSSYNTVNQCNSFSQTTGGQTFDKRAVGTLEGDGITLTTTWTDMFTVTLWTLGNTAPQGGYVVINSSGSGTPGPFGNYEVSDADATPYTVNSLTYTTPLALGSGSLPITLSKFTGACNGTGALLSWETSTEVNNDRFEIQKSDNGNTGWNTIASVKGAGNSTSLKQYQYADVQSNGTSYYRLRQVDIDGKSAISSVVKVDCENKASQLVVYPVPAENMMNIVLSAERNSRATIKLLDVAGRVYKLQRTDLLKGSNKIILNVADLLSGQYILRIEKDNEVQTKEVFIK